MPRAPIFAHFCPFSYSFSPSRREFSPKLAATARLGVFITVQTAAAALLAAVLLCRLPALPVCLSARQKLAAVFIKPFHFPPALSSSFPRVVAAVYSTSPSTYPLPCTTPDRTSPTTDRPASRPALLRCTARGSFSRQRHPRRLHYAKGGQSADSALDVHQPRRPATPLRAPLRAPRRRHCKLPVHSVPAAA